MALIDVIEIESKGETRRIELHHGDLTELTPADAVDLLVVSAFPDDYIPTRTSLIGALDRKGVSVRYLATIKAVDLRKEFSCWLSQPLKGSMPGIQYKRILCFEPLVRGKPPEVVGDIFRAIAPFLGDDPPIRSIAMPIVAAGNQRQPTEEMLRPLLEAAINWLSIGLPIETLKIFAHKKSQAKTAAELFQTLKEKISPPAPEPRGFKYDVFISYSRQDEKAGQDLAACLNRAGKKVYIDVHSLEKGAAWQASIFAALDQCARVAAIYSPDYIASKICQEEFNIAWTRGRNEESRIIFPIYWKSAKLPTYMEMLNFVDCREGERNGISTACRELVASLNVRPNPN